MSSGKLKFYYNKESNELIIADKDMVVVDNLLTDKIAVHTPTQEDWDYVIGKVRENYYNNWDSCGKVTCIELSNGCYDDGEWYECNNYHLITIDKFRAMFKDEDHKHGKVYIRGHITRGAEVIAKLEIIGGVNKWGYSGSYDDLYYFILEDNSISRCDINDKPEGYTEIFLDEPVTEEPKPTKEQVELKVVEYAKSVNWDYEKIWDRVGGDIGLEEFNLLNGSNTSEKIQHIFDKYKPKSESDITELKSDKTDSSGYKQSENKLSYELDWNFITQMAERMDSNKGKYEPYNWKKPIDTQELRNAITRHAIEVAKGNFDDDGRPFGHLEALACNSMMLNFQLHNKK